jgi:hypothetical protein
LQQTLSELRSYRDWTCNGLLEFRKVLVTHFRYLCPRPGKGPSRGAALCAAATGAIATNIRKTAKQLGSFGIFLRASTIKVVNRQTV